MSMPGEDFDPFAGIPVSGDDDGGAFGAFEPSELDAAELPPGVLPGRLEGDNGAGEPLPTGVAEGTLPGPPADVPLPSEEEIAEEEARIAAEVAADEEREAIELQYEDEVTPAEPEPNHAPTEPEPAAEGPKTTRRKAGASEAPARRGRPPREGAEAVPLRSYLVFDTGELDNGDPYFFQIAAVSARNREHAVRRTIRDLGITLEVGITHRWRVITRDTWGALTITAEPSVPRPPKLGITGV